MGTHALHSPGELVSRLIYDSKQGLILHNTIKKKAILEEKSGIMGLDSLVNDLLEDGEYRLGDLAMLVVGQNEKNRKLKNTIYVSEESRGRGVGYYLHDSSVNSYVVDLKYVVREDNIELELLEGFKKVTQEGLRDIDDSLILEDLIKELDKNYDELLNSMGNIYNKTVEGIIRDRNKAYNASKIKHQSEDK